MFRLLESIFGDRRRHDAVVDEEIVVRAIERLVDGTDPRMRAVPRYRSTLRPAVEASVAYVIGLVEALPPPVTLSPRAYREDPRLNAIFASPARVSEVLGESVALRTFLAESPGLRPSKVFAGLGVTHEKRRTFGAETSGDILRRDVEQTIVNFGSHQVAAIAGDEEGARHELMRVAYDELVQAVLERFAERQSEQERLEQEARLLRSRARALRSGRAGVTGLTSGDRDPPASAAEVDGQLARIETELSALGTPVEALERLVALAASTLAEPERHLRKESTALRVDAMSREVDAGADSSAPAFELDTFFDHRGEHVSVLLVEISTGDVPAQDDLLRRARRTL